MNKNVSAFAALVATVILLMTPLATTRAHAAGSLMISFDMITYKQARW
jgi:hypothetical protein